MKTLPELREAIDEHFPAALRLLRELVDIGSWSLDPEGVNRVGDVLADRFAELGFAAERVQAVDAGCGQHLFLSKPGTGDIALLLIGHLDTVYSDGELERHDFRWREDGDRVFGPGTVDIKGGNAMIWLVLTALREADPDFFEAVHWRVHFNAAEELLGADFAVGSRKRLAPASRAALVFEFGPCAGREWKILTGRKGRARMRVRVEGRSAHAGHPELGASAVRQIAELVPKIEALTDPARGLTANVGVIRGGEATNVVPPHAEAELEIRARDSADLDGAVAKILALGGRGTVSTSLGDFTCRVQVELIDRIEAWNSAHSASRPLLEAWRNAGEQLGLRIDGYERGGLSDGNYLAAAGIPTLDGLGPDGGNLHSAQRDDDAGHEPEFVRIDTFAEKALLNALAIRSLG